MRTSLGVDIAAPPSLVFALAHDVTRWADLLPHYLRSRPLAREAGGVVVLFVARREILGLPGFGLPVAWRALTWSEPADCRLRFVHRGGATAGMDVTWRIEAAGDGRSRVTIEHDFAAPPVWAGFVDRFFTQAIASRTLASFRAIAEAVASNGPDSTNTQSMNTRP